jgi:hypothetical protein
MDEAKDWRMKMDEGKGCMKALFFADCCKYLQM